LSDQQVTLQEFKPNPKRQTIFVGLALIGLGFGYGLGFFFKHPPVSPPKPPIAVVKLSALPTLKLKPEPEPQPKTQNIRPYEEALPDNVIETIQTEPPSPIKPIKWPSSEPNANTSVIAKPSEPISNQKQLIAPTWQRNALSVAADGRPMIALIFDDLGVDKSRTRRIIALSGPLTLSFLAYSTGLEDLSKQGHDAGHEIFLHVPMEPSSSHVDPGPNVLLTNQPRPELLTIFRWNLDRMDGYVGINNHMGSQFTENFEGMSIIMGELKVRGLAFLDSLTSSHSVGRRAAAAAGVPFITRNVFIDHDEAPEKIKQRLRDVERLAEQQGHAIAIGHPREATLKAVKPWLIGITKRGFQLVPASTLIRREEALLAPKDLFPPQTSGAH